MRCCRQTSVLLRTRALCPHTARCSRRSAGWSTGDCASSCARHRPKQSLTRTWPTLARRPPFAFKTSMTHCALRFALPIALCCVLHRRESQDIRWGKLCRCCSSAYAGLRCCLCVVLGECRVHVVGWCWGGPVEAAPLSGRTRARATRSPDGHRV